IAGFDHTVEYLTGGSMLYHHTICPIIAIVSFMFLEDNSSIEKKQVFLSILPTGLYAVPVLILNIAKIMYGPYPFLYVYEQPIWMTCIWIIVILAMAALLSFLLYLPAKIRRKKNKTAHESLHA
ncbi:MAG TPA: hypothetical protein PLT66_09535, partial [Bacillota bacterium]|nr:hypothetical protein [Bacillota bacterium]